MTAVMREQETVTPLELFFDLVFVLALTPTAALLGGAALYLLAHVGFRLRNIHTLNSRRLGLAVVLVAFTPLAYELELPAPGTLAILSASLVALIAYETHKYGDARGRIRNELRHEHETGEAAEA